MFRRCKPAYILGQDNSNSFLYTMKTKLASKTLSTLSNCQRVERKYWQINPKSQSHCNSTYGMGGIRQSLQEWFITTVLKYIRINTCTNSCVYSSLILKCIYNTLMGVPRTSYAATMWKYVLSNNHSISPYLSKLWPLGTGLNNKN